MLPFPILSINNKLAVEDVSSFFVLTMPMLIFSSLALPPPDFANNILQSNLDLELLGLQLIANTFPYLLIVFSIL